MKLLQIAMLCIGLILCLCVSGGQTLRLQQRREANAAPQSVQDAELAAATKEVEAGETDESAEQFVSDTTTTAKPLGIVSIKSRAIAMDRALCQELSRYDPHYPKCHHYCRKLDHWIGQCWRDSCHCIS